MTIKQVLDIVYMVVLNDMKPYYVCYLIELLPFVLYLEYQILMNQNLLYQCVQWHANCNYIATGSSDKTVRLWDVQSGECVRIFIGHRSMILSLAMSPDGRYMASGDEDGAIMMWDLSSGRCVMPLIGHTSCVWTLAFR